MHCSSVVVITRLLLACKNSINCSVVSSSSRNLQSRPRHLTDLVSFGLCSPSIIHCCSQCTECSSLPTINGPCTGKYGGAGVCIFKSPSSDDGGSYIDGACSERLKTSSAARKLRVRRPPGPAIAAGPTSVVRATRRLEVCFQDPVYPNDALLLIVPTSLAVKEILKIAKEAGGTHCKSLADIGRPCWRCLM